MVVRHSLSVLEENGHFGPVGTYPANSRIYTVDMLIDALEFVLYNTYVQFGGYLFKQILLRHSNGGNASPFIADLYLTCNEYQFIKKNNSSLAKQLPYAAHKKFMSNCGKHTVWMHFPGFSKCHH